MFRGFGEKKTVIDAQCQLQDVKQGFKSGGIQMAIYCETLQVMIALHDWITG